jgi:hypothetical protein
MNLLGIMSMDFDVTDLLLIRYSEFSRYCIKIGVQRYNTTAIYRRKITYDSGLQLEYPWN